MSSELLVKIRAEVAASVAALDDLSYGGRFTVSQPSVPGLDGDPAIPLLICTPAGAVSAEKSSAQLNGHIGRHGDRPVDDRVEHVRLDRPTSSNMFKKRLRRRHPRGVSPARMNFRHAHERGCGLAVITTDLRSTPDVLIARYASRWSIEPVFFGARRILGVGEAQPATRLGPAHRPVRIDHLQPDRPVVRPSQPRPRTDCRRARPRALVHHQDRVLLPGHGDQAAPRDHRRTFSAPRSL